MRFEHDLPEAEYHARPEFSQSGAKIILDCPARFRYQQDHPKPPTPSMEHGTVVHALVLEQPPAHVEVDASDWRTKAAKDAAQAARDKGLIPLLSKDVRRAEAMAKAVRDHDYAGAVLAVEGANELTMLWTDERTGIDCRGRIDRLATDDSGTPTIVDLKTTSHVAPGRFSRTAADFGYHVQAGAYTDGYRTITGDTPAYLIVAVEAEPPHFVSVFTFTAADLDAGTQKWADALDLYRECTTTGHWPGYPTTPVPLSLPPWA